MHPRERRGVWASAAALILGVFLFQCLLPVGFEDRHLISALPAAMMFVFAGFHALRHWLARRRGGDTDPPATGARTHGWLCLLLVLGFLTSQMFALIHPHRKRWSGFATIAETILADESTAQGTVLVSSDARGEGMFISELAMHETRPGHVVLRANKVLASMQWSGADVHPKFADEADLLAYFAKSDIAYVVVDDSMPDDKRGAHHDQLRHAAEDHPDLFWPVATAPVIRAGGTYPTPLRAYRVKHPAP